MAFRAFLDTCVLYPIGLCDLLLRIAEQRVFVPLWSAEVVSELERNLVVTAGLDQPKAARRIAMMSAAFPSAAVTGYAALTPVMTCHPKDRHVAAAAIRGEAQVLVTFNLRDFPAESLSDYDVEVIGPDDFLCAQLDLHPTRVLTALEEQVAAYRNPRRDAAHLLTMLEAMGLRGFVDEVRRRTD